MKAVTKPSTQTTSYMENADNGIMDNRVIKDIHQDKTSEEDINNHSKVTKDIRDTKATIKTNNKVTHIKVTILEEINYEATS